MRMWQTIRAARFGRHVHQQAYATLVLSGGYEEAGDLGRFQVAAGDVVFHDRFEAHSDTFPARGAEVLNLRLPTGCRYSPGMARAADPDSVARLAERDHREAVHLLVSTAASITPQPGDWADQLGAALIQTPSLQLSRWGETHGVTSWAISRGFVQAFGVTPEAFRARARARHALRSIETTGQPLASIAADLGFSDQPHMTRSIHALTGSTPRALRHAANAFKTAR
jgi:AraC-like DNA-binding protein